MPPDQTTVPLADPAQMPPVVHETVSRIEPREDPWQVVRETRETRLVSEMIRDRSPHFVESQELVRLAPRQAESGPAADPDPPAVPPEPISVEVEIGSIEIVQAAPAAPPARSPVPRRPQARGFAGLARQRRYSDRHWY